MSQSQDAHSYKLEDHDGRLVIQSGAGEPVSWASYTLTSHVNMENWEVMNMPFLRAGVGLYQLQVWPGSAGRGYWANVFWSHDGKPVVDPEHAQVLNEQVAVILKHDPEARFVIRIRTHPDSDWRDENLSEFQPVKEFHGSWNGAAEWSIMSSLASDLVLERTKMCVRDHIAWCEQQDWHERIVGYMLLPFGEGGTDVANHGGLFDRSEAMTAAFRRYATETYDSDEALREAWGMAHVRRESVRVPTEAVWYDKKEREAVLHWPDPAKVRRERDYFDLQKRLFHRWWTAVIAEADAATAARPCIVGVDNYKQPQHGWLHNPGFFGKWDETTLDRHGNWMVTTGCIGVAPLLDAPGLDVVWTPGMYYNRGMGYAWEAEGLTDSLVLRGKLNYVEGDFRSWVDRNIDGVERNASQVADAGVPMNTEELQATYRRAIAWAISRNQMFWFCSVYGGNWWYHAPEIEPLLQESNTLIERSLTIPWSTQRDAVCIVIDDESGLYEDFSGGFQHLAVNRQIEEGLAHCGVPYRIHLLSDLERDNFPAYKTYLFPNLFRIDDDVLKLLDRKVLRDGNVAIFGPGTGITDGKTRSADGASKLFGVEMELHLSRTTRRLLIAGTLARSMNPEIVAESYSYGPLLVPTQQRFPADSPARELGNAFYYHNLDRPGAFVVERGLGAAANGKAGERGAGDSALIFVPAVPLPAGFLREAARFAGSHVYSEQNVVVYAQPGFIGLHVPAAGDWQIRLPGPNRVTDLATGALITERAESLIISTTGPDTRLLHLEPVR